MKIVAFLPAKGSSSRVKNKNLQLLDGKPLFLHTLEKLVASNIFDDVYLDTESQEIIDLASEVKCKILHRDSSLASNKTDGNDLFLNEIKNIKAHIYVQVLCTSPFIKIETIQAGIDMLVKNKTFDSAFLVKREKLYTWIDGEPSYDVNNIPNSVDLDEITIETMGLYIIKRDAAIEQKRRIGLNPFFIDASPLESIDVNWPDDFKLAELIAAGLREKDRKLLANIKVSLNSSMLSDILDDMEFPNQVIKGLSPNIAGSKLLGRAKTLKLRKLSKDEDASGIYNALNSYDTIIPNDVILVENEISEYAYFGELNANLTIRSGGSGVIVDGMTRDEQAVRSIGLPVFSKGQSCQDVRNRATTESFNKTIHIGGVKIEPGSLVFADDEGIIIIPKTIENEVIDKVYEKLATEKNIISEIASGISIDDLTENYGFF